MYQPGTISTPGTSIQGQLVRHTLSSRELHPATPILAQTVTQCGVPAVLPYGNGSCALFVAGQVNGLNSPFSAPWPLFPLYLHADSDSAEWQLTRLPDRVHDRHHFVSGIPSAVLNGEELLVYFNGAQLLEYRCTPDQWWHVSAVPTPDVVVEANPVAAIVGDHVFVFCIPGAESLLMCSRALAASDHWQFSELSGGAFDGDPAVVFFAGRLHVLVSASSPNSTSPETFELWDFVVNPDTYEAAASSISASIDALNPPAANAIAGTPAAIVSGQGIRVFARSTQNELVEFFSTDGNAWDLNRISALKIGGDPGAVLLGDGTPLVCVVDQQGRLLHFTCTAGTWQATEVSSEPNDIQRRPLPVRLRSGVSVFDLKVAL
jgi:hypothetical protein